MTHLGSAPSWMARIEPGDVLGALYDTHHATLASPSPSAVTDTYAALVEGLTNLRESLSAPAWRKAVAATRGHPTRKLLMEDPFTRRCYQKPRGRPDDAVMLDFAYRHGSVRPMVRRASGVGQRVHRAATASRYAEAIRHRREILAEHIDAALTESATRILGMGVGHLREASSVDFETADLDLFIAADADARTQPVVRATARHPRIRHQQLSARDVLDNRLTESAFHLIYATGMFDQLDDTSGRALTRRLASHLAPGGQLLISGTLPTCADRAFAEAVLDVHRVYRNEGDLVRMVHTAWRGGLAVARCWRGGAGQLVYVLAERM